MCVRVCEGVALMCTVLPAQFRIQDGALLSTLSLATLSLATLSLYSLCPRMGSSRPACRLALRVRLGGDVRRAKNERRRAAKEAQDGLGLGLGLGLKWTGLGCASQAD